jgi:catechol 2,3-dioxygenase-like lactoylglutathione lyase family enzyme
MTKAGEVLRQHVRFLTATVGRPWIKVPVTEATNPADLALPAQKGEPIGNRIPSGEVNRLWLAGRSVRLQFMHFNHLGLPVRDERRSRQFYSAYFGFDPATAQEYPDGTVIIRNADGFDLALHPAGHITPPPAFLHSGFRAAGPADVRALMDRIEADGITIVERNDDADYTAFKCLDPDGHRIEVYWEPPFSR